MPETLIALTAFLAACGLSFAAGMSWRRQDRIDDARVEDAMATAICRLDERLGKLERLHALSDD